MGCDLSSNTLKKKFESDQDWNQNCRCNLGWSGAGHMPSEIWYEPNLSTFPSYYTIFTTGKVLTRQFFGINICQWQWRNASQVLQIRLFTDNVPFTDTTFGDYTVQVHFSLSAPTGVGTGQRREVAIRSYIWPSFGSTLSADTWRVLVPPGGTPLTSGTVSFTPLRRCHTCTSDP